MVPSEVLIPEKSIMLVTNQLQQAPNGGRALLCKFNHDVLKDIYGKDLVLFEIQKSPLLGLHEVFNTLKGHIDGLNDVTIARSLQMIESKNIGKVFVDGSNLGGFVKIIKQRFPGVEICTFFHNVEVRFFLGSLRQAKTFRALAVLLANYLAERKSVHFSDKRVCLNERDSCLLKKIYGRGATHVSPMSMEDKLSSEYDTNKIRGVKKFALFVGGIFYANRFGIKWFVENVAPRININVCVVGKGFERLRSELEIKGKVEVVGAVDSMSDWYHNAQFVIAPIFDGSGMKTKVAEALMYGKKIIGTPEAFTGYEDVVVQAGWVCETANEFVAAIEEAEREVTAGFDQALRMLYLQHYSFSAARARIKLIMEDSI